MLERIHRILTRAACVVALAASLAPAHATPQTVLTARVSGDPFVVVWVDGADQTTRADEEAMVGIASQIAGSEWTFAEDQSDPQQPIRALSIAKYGHILLKVGYISDDERTVFLMHGR